MRLMKFASCAVASTRCLPLWVRCVGIGLCASWLVALGDWLLTELGARARPVFVTKDQDFSGASAVEYFYRRAHGMPPRGELPLDSQFYAISYGWPIRNWGTVFQDTSASPWQLGIKPVLAVDLRSIWPPGANGRDPMNPQYSPQNPPPPLASGCARAILYFDPYARYLPSFPLFGPSLLASIVYGFPLFLACKLRQRRHEHHQCRACGYETRQLQSSLCPECGTTLTPEQARSAALPPERAAAGFAVAPPLVSEIAADARDCDVELEIDEPVQPWRENELASTFR